MIHAIPKGAATIDLRALKLAIASWTFKQSCLEVSPQCIELHNVCGRTLFLIHYAAKQPEEEPRLGEIVIADNI